MYWIIAPIMYCTCGPMLDNTNLNFCIDKNVFYAMYMPIAASWSFDDKGEIYNATRVIVDGQFDVDACTFSLLPLAPF
jgi:hypothetical protein